VRLLARLFYGCIVLETFAGRGSAKGLAHLEGLTPKEFQAAVAEGRLRSGEPETAYAFGLMSLRAFTDGLSRPGVERTFALAAEA
jgi:hypothetical protein